jgi:hypothetical protein
MTGRPNSDCRSAASRLHGVLASLIDDFVALVVMGRTLFLRAPGRPTTHESTGDGGAAQIGQRRGARRISKHSSACLTLQKH